MTIRYCDFLNGNDANPGTELSPKKNAQAIVDISTRGDVMRVANTAIINLTSPLAWNTGFVNSGNGFFVIEGWDNGGGLFIQRPDELTPRTAVAKFSGGGVSSGMLGYAPPPTVLRNITLDNYTYMPVDGYGGGPINTYGCEFVGQTDSRFIRYLRGQDKSVGDYIHSNTSTRQAIDATDGSLCQIADGYFNHSGSNGSIALDNWNNFIRNKVVLNASNSFIFYIVNNVGIFENNILIANGSAGQKAISIDRANIDLFRNNVFYGFNGVGSAPLELTGNFQADVYGPNAFYDCNPSIIPALGILGVDFQSDDIVGTGDPFVDSANGDYTLVTSSLARSSAVTNPGSFLDMGAVQSKSEVIVPSTDANSLRANRGCE